MIQIESTGATLPSRILYYGKPGTGKTTFGAFTPKPIFICTPGETGVVTLASYNLVPKCDLIKVKSWRDLMQAIDYLTKEPHQYRSLIMDTVNGAERLCVDQVCQSLFGGDMKTYVSYGKGYESSIPTWRSMFAKLDNLRESRSMGIVLLAHSIVKRQNNPDTDPYDIHYPQIADKLWEPVSQWADITVFAHRYTQTEKNGLRYKATTLDSLKLSVCEGKAHLAKNRAGMFEDIEINDPNPAAIYATFAAHLKAARERANGDKVVVEPVTTPIEEVVQEPVAA